MPRHNLARLSDYFCAISLTHPKLEAQRTGDGCIHALTDTPLGLPLATIRHTQTHPHRFKFPGSSHGPTY